MADFSKEIQDFQRYGTYTYKFDSSGNLTFDSSSSDFSRVYLSFSLLNHVYNKSKIQSFYDTNFTEFIPTTTQSTPELTTTADVQQINDLTTENESLKTQLDALIFAANANITEAEKLATKDVILELRIALGQGRVESDFSSDFPYMPIQKTTNIISDSTN